MRSRYVMFCYVLMKLSETMHCCAEACHTTMQWSPKISPPDQVRRAWMVPAPCTAATLGARGPSTELSITIVGPPSHGRSPTAGPFNGVATSV